jgi:hypothetical protein
MPIMTPCLAPSADWASLAARGLGIVPGREGEVNYFLQNGRRGNLDWLSSSILAIYDTSLGCRSHGLVEGWLLRRSPLSARTCCAG